MTRIPVVSSSIVSVGWCPGGGGTAFRTLEVEFHGGAIHQYLDVPQECFAAMAGAASPGRFFNRVIKGNYTSHKIRVGVRNPGPPPAPAPDRFDYQRLVLFRGHVGTTPSYGDFPLRRPPGMHTLGAIELMVHSGCRDASAMVTIHAANISPVALAVRSCTLALIEVEAPYITAFFTVSEPGVLELAINLRRGGLLPAPLSNSEIKEDYRNVYRS